MRSWSASPRTGERRVSEEGNRRASLYLAEGGKRGSVDRKEVTRLSEIAAVRWCGVA
jgi:hypothetical protein